MTIVEIATAASDPGNPARSAVRSAMVSSGGALAARYALESSLPAGIVHHSTSTEFQIEEQLLREVSHRPPTNGHQAKNHQVSNTNSEEKTKNNAGEKGGKRMTSTERKENIYHQTRLDVTKDSKTDLYVSKNVVNRITENGAGKKGKDKTAPPVSTTGKKLNGPSSSTDRVNVDKADSLIGENIAANNAGGQYPSDMVRAIQYSDIQNVLRMSTKGVTLNSCVSCGEECSGNATGMCKQCMHHSKSSDEKTGTLDELISYAQSIAKSVKKMLTLKTNMNMEGNHTDKELMQYPSREFRHTLRCSTPASSVCGDDIERMNVLEGETMKRQTSGLTNADVRPSLSRAKSKVKNLGATSRGKSFRPQVTRMRTGHELKADALTNITAKIDAKKSGLEPNRKSGGRTHTFDSCYLQGRKDATSRNRKDVIIEGTSVDPPKSDDIKADKKFSRSATSPGTNLVNKRENSNLTTPFKRSNSKLTLRANKAATLRMGNKSHNLFHEQPIAEGDEASPMVERRRGASCNRYSNNPKSKPPRGAAMRYKVRDESPARPVIKDNDPGITNLIKQELSDVQKQEEVPKKVLMPHNIEETGSNIYCAESIAKPLDMEGVYHEVAKNSSQYDDLSLYESGQIIQSQVGEQASLLAVTPYFAKASLRGAHTAELQAGDGANLYTGLVKMVDDEQVKPVECASSQWYRLHGVLSTSSTHIKQTASVRSSLSDVSILGSGSTLSRKRAQYMETDVDCGTIYHMAKRTTSNDGDFAVGFNFFDTEGDVSRSSSCTSDGGRQVTDTMYTGGFFGDASDESEKKGDVSATASHSSTSDQTYFESDSESKAQQLEPDIYTGNVFSPSENNLALSEMSDDWKNVSTNNSNRYRYPPHRCRSRITMAHIRRPLTDCSNNSSSSRSAGKQKDPQIVTSSTSSYVDFKGLKRPVVTPVSFNFPDSEMIDFRKYDNIGQDKTGFFFSSSKKYADEGDNVYEGQACGFQNKSKSYQTTSQNAYGCEDLYTAGDRNTNVNNNTNGVDQLDSNNNYFGDFYSDATYGDQTEAYQPAQTAVPSAELTSMPSPKYAPGSFYEHAYEERPASPTPSRFSSQGCYEYDCCDPPIRQHRQISPDYAGPLSHSNPSEVSYGDVYESYDINSSPKRSTYDQYGYYDFNAPEKEHGSEFLDRAKHPVKPAKPLIKRVGAIVCRDNVANKDDYAEDVNRDLMEDPWIPITYRLAAEQVKEMGGGRHSSTKDIFRATEARGEPNFMDNSPFVQGQILESLGRKNTQQWDLKKNSENLKEDISMKWKEASEKNERQQCQTKQRRSNMTTVSSVWRPSDHIPEKARGNRTITKSEKSNKNSSNTNNSRVWSAVMWVPSTVGSYVKKLW